MEETKPTTRGPNRGGLTFHPLKDNQILRTYREHKKNVAELKDKLFLLLAHPDTTQEMLDVARGVAQRTHQGEVKLRNEMRAAGYNVD